MFDDYEDVEDYEDELYREASSSESSVESDVEFHLYSQVHYAQDLRELNEEQECVGRRAVFKSGPSERTDDDALSDNGSILVSDGADIITVSGTTDEESIYKCKGNSLDNFRARINEDKPQGHSTPVTACKQPLSKCCKEEVHPTADIEPSFKNHVKELQGVNKNDLESVILIDSSEEEDSRDEDTSQDDYEEHDESDQIEEWMLIGSSKEAADTSISLNLEGCRASDSNQGETDVEWSVGEKDREAQIVNAPGRRRLYRYYTTDKNIRCKNCDKQGHLFKDCPTPKKSPVCCLCGEKDHFLNSCPERPCTNCSLPGHFYRECIERPYWKKHCHRCEMRGHYADACPEVWRQYHITITPGSPVRLPKQPANKKKGYCYNCAQKGHHGHECTVKRMTPWTLPTSPFIFSYDTKYTIEKREKRIHRKIQEFCEAGLWEMPVAAKRPRFENDSTTEPLKKKKKKKKKRSRGIHQDLKEEKYKPDRNKKSRQMKENQKGSQSKELFSFERMEDAFPRGSLVRHQVVNATQKQHSNSAVLFHGCEMESGFPVLTKKRKRKKAGKKAIKDESSGATENLFLIKQRKRKRNRSQKL